MNDEKLTELAAEIEQQNEALAQIEATMRSLGDVDLAVPKALLDELDELTMPRNTTPVLFTYGLRA